MIYFVRLALVLAFPITILAFSLTALLNISDRDEGLTIIDEISLTFNDFVRLHKDTWSKK